jgi:murein DD-endopeptidase MepM/ murein hydrolase activator NlpD
MTRMVRRSLFFIIGIFILSSSIVFVPHFIHAQTAEELQQNAKDLKDKITQLDKEIKEYNLKISQTQGEAKSLKQALASLELRKAALIKDIEKTQFQIDQAKSSISNTQASIVVTTTKLSRNKDGLAETFRSLVYENNQLPELVRMLGKSSALSDVLNTLKLGQDVSRAINEKVAELSGTKQELTSQKEVYELNKKTLESLNSSLSDQKALVEQTKTETNSLLVQTKNKETEYQKLVAERKKKKGDLESEVLDVEAKIKVIVDASKLPKFGKGVLLFPVNNVNITQYFGNTPFASQNPQVYNGSGHNGVDFAVPVGSSIYAAQGGVVLGTGNTDAACTGVSYGKWVLIRHDNGLTSLYAHLSVIQVTAGQHVDARQKIALSGNTGYSTGPHLHFTVYASDSVHISGPTEYKSKVCGTYLIMPLAPRSGYLNPLTYL